MKRWLGPLGMILAVFSLSVLALIEFEIRRSGLDDRPLYRADAVIGYIPRPSQQGKYANAVEWAFNERSMRTAQPFKPSDAARDILLIGDSVVFARHDHAATPGPELARVSGAQVWPIAAPSWGLANELTYLENNPDIARTVDDIVFVVNSGDFGPASHWVNNFMHPTGKPRSLAAYWLGSQFLMGWDGDAIAVADRGPLGPRLARLRGQTKARMLFLYYPTRDELAANTPCFEIPDALRSFPGYCLGLDPEWSPAFYLDLVHPRPDASPLLGRAMARALEAASSSLPVTGFTPGNAQDQR